MQHLPSHDIFQIHECPNYHLSSCAYTHCFQCHYWMCRFMAEKQSGNYIQQGAGTILHAKAELLLTQDAQMSISTLEKLFSAQTFWDGMF